MSTVNPKAAALRSGGRSGSPARPGVVALIGLLLVGSAGGAASAQSGADPWQLYVDAASRASSKKSAATLLKAALDVAQRNDPDGLRPALTRLFLHAAYVGLDRMDLVWSVGAVRIDLARVDASYGPTLPAFARMANEYYAAWKRLPAAPETEDARIKKAAVLEVAARLAGVEVALRRKLEDQDPAELAKALARYGDLREKQGGLEEARKSLEEADGIWNGIVAKRNEWVAASRQVSLFPATDNPAPVLPNGDDPIFVKLVLARYYGWMGQDHRKDGKTDEAVREFRASEAKLREALDLFEKDWPDHQTTGLLYFWLATTYANWEGKAEAAETAYRRALAIYEAVEGPASANVAFIVKNFAEALRRAGKPDAARDLEARYRIGQGGG